jgi:hypothetical protein
MMVAPCKPEAIRHILAAALTDKTGGAGRFDLEQLFDGATCIGIKDAAGEIVAGYVLKAEGDTLWIRAGAGRAKVDLCDVMNEALDHQGRQFARIGFQTRRAGLIKKAQARGYVATGKKDGFTVMEKRL